MRRLNDALDIRNRYAPFRGLLTHMDPELDSIEELTAHD